MHRSTGSLLSRTIECDSGPILPWPRGGRTLANRQGEPLKGTPVSYRAFVSITAAAILCIACVSTEATARGVARAGGVRAGGVHGAYAGGARVAGVHGPYRGGAYRGGVYRGGYRPGYGIGAAAAGTAIGAAAVGAAVAAPYYEENYYNSTQCGYAPYPPCY
jgi:hypothetical protein